MSTLGVIAALSLLGAAGMALGPYVARVRREPLSVTSRAGWVNRLLQLAEDASAVGQPAIASSARALIEALIEEPKSVSKGK